MSSTINRAVTCPYISYTYTESETDEVVASHLVKEFDPQTVSWDDAKSSYILDATFPVSSSWASVTWASVGSSDFTETLFKTYYPGDYGDQFPGGSNHSNRDRLPRKHEKIVVDGFMKMTEEEYEALFTKTTNEANEEVYEITDRE